MGVWRGRDTERKRGRWAPSRKVPKECDYSKERDRKVSVQGKIESNSRKGVLSEE